MEGETFCPAGWYALERKSARTGGVSLNPVLPLLKASPRQIVTLSSARSGRSEETHPTTLQLTLLRRPGSHVGRVYF